MTIEMLLEYIAIITDANKAQYDELTMNLNVADTGGTFFVERKDGVLLSYPGETRKDAQVTVTCVKPQLFAALMGKAVEGIKIEGDATTLKRLTRYATAFTIKQVS